MRSKWILSAILVAWLPSCAEDAVKGGEPDDSGLTDYANVGAADGFGPYRGTIAWGVPEAASLDPQTWYHLYELEVTGSSTARVEVAGDAGADAYLIIYYWNGNSWSRLAYNDDCRTSTLDSCVERSLRSGRYLVLVSTYDAIVRGVTPNAAYTVRVNCRRGTCANLLCGVEGSRDVPTDFVSADEPTALFRPLGRRTLDPVLEAAPDKGGERTVEQGDIYRVLGGGFLLNLNSYRGLQVIDASDPTYPEVVGRAALSGTPVEMYVVDQVAYVLLNNWYGYYGATVDLGVESYQGGVLVSVDLSNPQSPEVLDQVELPGSIRTSRLTRGSGAIALYVASDTSGRAEHSDGNVTWETRTGVTSFGLYDGIIERVGALDVGGSVADIQATTEALLVARNDWNGTQTTSRVAVIDISDPRGQIGWIGEVRPQGQVQSKTNMDYRDGVLRVVSGRTWGGTSANHLETFDGQTLEPIDHCQFGDGQSLFATLFLDDRAFFVTYLQVDPFHAFALDASGRCEERAEFVVSGWNNFFRPVLEESRLIGIGTNDEAGRTLSVSLYDITDLDNERPLVARADVPMANGWSEATWDDRAFGVLEEAVAVQAGEVLETGMVLLPFQGWNDAAGEYVTAVQIFTFSDSTLTRRGVMTHGSPVRRTFLSDDATVGNLSDVELRLYAHGDPDRPEELGRLDLAPDYADVLVYGSYAARLHRSSSDTMGWWGDRAELPPSTVQIVPLSGAVDAAQPVAEIQVPADATLEQVGRLLVVVSKRPNERPREDGTGSELTSVEVWDLANPAVPTRIGETATDRIEPSSGGWFGPRIMCVRWPCPGFRTQEERFVAGNSIVFLSRTPHEEVIGEETACTLEPIQPVCDAGSACGTVSGWVYCTSRDGGTEMCSGEMRMCEPSPEGELCRIVDPGSIETRETCNTYPRTRYSQSYTAHVLDLSRPNRPAFGSPVAVPAGEDAVGAVADGARLWLSLKMPEVVSGDGRDHARYFARTLDVTRPSRPVLGERVNVPGQIFAADGQTLYTREPVWADNRLESRISRSIACDGRAYQQASRLFADDEVAQTALDDRGHLLVSHRLSWQVASERGETVVPQRLSVLDLRRLSVTGDVLLADWATLRTAEEGRALFEVPGGLLVVNTEDGANPFAQAYVSLQGWPTKFVITAERLLFAAGRFGIYDLGLDFANLL